MRSQLETIDIQEKPVDRPISNVNRSRASSLRPISSKLETITSINVLNTKKFLPSLSPMNNYTMFKPKKKIIQNSNTKKNIHDYQLNSLNDNVTSSNFQDDWSKDEEFFEPLEAFLNNQLKREKSSKRRCKEIIKVRNIENTRKFIDNAIRDFDEKINLNLLVKSRESASKTNSSSFSEFSNYRILIAEEILRINSKCVRCKEKNRRYEENLFEPHLNFHGNKNLKKNILPHLTSNHQYHHQYHNHSHNHSHNTFGTSLSNNQNKNQSKLLNLGDKSSNNVHKFFSRSNGKSNNLYESADKSLLFNLMPNTNKKQIISKHRI